MSQTGQSVIGHGSNELAGHGSNGSVFIGHGSIGSMDLGSGGQLAWVT